MDVDVHMAGWRWTKVERQSFEMIRFFLIIVVFPNLWVYLLDGGLCALPRHKLDGGTLHLVVDVNNNEGKKEKQMVLTINENLCMQKTEISKNEH